MANQTRLVNNVRRRKRKGPASLGAVDLLHIQPGATVQVPGCIREVVREAEQVGDTIALIPEDGEGGPSPAGPTPICAATCASGWSAGSGLLSGVIAASCAPIVRISG